MRLGRRGEQSRLILPVTTPGPDGTQNIGPRPAVRDTPAYLLPRQSRRATSGTVLSRSASQSPFLEVLPEVHLPTAVELPSATPAPYGVLEPAGSEFILEVPCKGDVTGTQLARTFVSRHFGNERGAAIAMVSIRHNVAVMGWRAGIQSSYLS
jgi:hypothetical protein